MSSNDIMIYNIIIVTIISIIFDAGIFYMWFASAFKVPLKQIPRQLKKEIKDTWNNFNKFLIVFIVFGCVVGIPIIVQLLVGFAFIGLLFAGNFLLWLFMLF